MKKFLLPIFLLLTTIHLRAQTVIDTVGNTIVELTVVLDSSHFQTGFMSSPWDLHWGPDQKLWYTNGTTLCTYDPGTQVADTIHSVTSGYIMAVTTHTDFFNNPYVYLTIDSSSYYGMGNNISLMRYDYSLTGDSLYNPLFLLNWYHPGEHSGGRVIFGQGEKIYVSTAEYWIGNDTLFNNSGKVLRINPDGTVPVDNPRADYTFTYGHRNPQGIVQVPNGNLFVSEYGQQWDELNLLQENRYFGWITYDGVSCISNQDSCDHYDSIAVFPLNVGLNPPSGIDFYNHPAIPEFNGLVQAVTGANSQGLIVYTMNSDFDSVLAKNYYFTGQYGRVRDACAAGDGSLYFIAGDRSFVPRVVAVRNPLFNNVYEHERLSFMCYPNPASDNIFYRLKDEGVYSISIVDLRGRTLWMHTTTQLSGVIDTSLLPGGCHTVVIKNDAGEMSCKKIVVIR